ncbi:MAG TPA: flagellar motor switch protein FliN [Solirubrobacteraceae bacterium]|nr:flagellar motor switch protein FliN [Solirubrobacteraceae bacterium]
MTETIEYEQFDQAPAASTTAGPEADLSRLSDIPMELSVEIGRAHMTVGEALDLHVGAVVSLERSSGEPVDLLVNGTPIARGEVVVIDEQYGLRITEIPDAHNEAGADGETPAPRAAEDSPADGSTPTGG